MGDDLSDEDSLLLVEASSQQLWLKATNPEDQDLWLTKLQV